MSLLGVDQEIICDHKGETVNYTVVQKLSDLPNLSSAKRILLDTETSGFDYFHGDRICGFSLGAYDDDNSNYYIPIRHRDCGSLLDAYSNLDVPNVLSYIQSLVGDPEKEIIGHNIKFDLNMMKADGIECKAKIWDTMILAHDLDGDKWNYELDTLTRLYVPGFVHTEAARLKASFAQTQPHVNTDEGKSLWNYSLEPIESLAPYAVEDIVGTRWLCQALEKLPRWPADYNFGFESWGLDQLIARDMKLIKVLAKMEYTGIRVDAGRCAYLRDNAEDDIATMNEWLFKLVGHSFQISSWKQMTDAFCDAGGRVIFWSAKVKGKQKKEKYTTDKEKSTGRPCYNAAALLEYLQIFKAEGNQRAYNFMLTWYKSEQKRRLVASNLEPYLKRLDMHGRLHGQFHAHRTITGRLASSNPNLQNITKTGGTVEQKILEKFLGVKDDDALNRQIRGLFIADPGEVLVSIDYSQLEYRIATVFSQDADMIATYARDASTDYHAETQRLAQITDRTQAKIVAFGCLYGLGKKSLAAFLNLPQLEAENIYNKIMNGRPALRRLMVDCQRQVKIRGFTQNGFGRRCAVPADFAYKGLNYWDQGTGGDLMRQALVNLDVFITENKLPVKMLSSIHDEILFGIPKDAVVEMVPKMEQIMNDNRFLASVPLYCDSDVGNSWGRDQIPFKEWCEKNVKRAA